MDFERARFNMIEQQIRPWRVLDPAVLESHLQLRREDFVPASMRQLAFSDVEIPLHLDGVDTGQCMLAPKVDARLVQALEIKRGESVLEIGTGSGWMAALLATRAIRVVSLEIHAGLANFARNNLKQAGLHQVEVIHADGSKPSASTLADWDVIVLSGSLEELPNGLLTRLKPGGRLIAIVGRRPVMEAQCFTKSTNGAIHSENLFETIAPPLLGFVKPSHFRL